MVSALTTAIAAEVRPRLGQLSVAEGGSAAGKIVPLLLPAVRRLCDPHTGAQYFVMTVCRLRPGSLSKLENLRSEGFKRKPTTPPFRAE